VSEPCHSDWAALYQAATIFREASPWNWLDNEDLFAIENPDDGEVGYCSVLGAGGEEFGLGMFVGEGGYRRYTAVIEGEEEPEDLEESIMARSLSMLFVDRGILQKEDREVIRSLGLRFRGRNGWPLFRSQLPGYVPWFLEKEEVFFLTTAIHQSLAVADRVRSGKLDLWEQERENVVLTRYRRSGNWLEEWRKPPRTADWEQESNTETMDAVKEAELHLLRSRTGGLNGHWELDIFVLPIPIGAVPDRPYFPSCLLVVESELGLVLSANLTEPWITSSQKQDEVIQVLREANQIPREIRVKSEKVKRIIEPMTEILGTELSVGSLPLLEQAKASLCQHFGRAKK